MSVNIVSHRTQTLFLILLVLVAVLIGLLVWLKPPLLDLSQLPSAVGTSLPSNSGSGSYCLEFSSCTTDTDGDGIMDCVDEYPEDSSKPVKHVSITNKNNNDLLNLANNQNVLFVNPNSPNWVTTTNKVQIRAQALNPATPAPSLRVLFTENVLKDGDTILMRGGIHFLPNPNDPGGETFVTFIGTADKPLTIKAYPEETAILTVSRIARCWEEATNEAKIILGTNSNLNGMKVYKKSFNKNYYNVMFNNTPMVGYSGSRWRNFDSTTGFLDLQSNNEQIKYFSISPLTGSELVGTYKNDNYPNTTIYISVPGGVNPNHVDNHLRVARGNLMKFRTRPDQSEVYHYIIEGLTFSYSSALKVEGRDQSDKKLDVTIRDNIFKDMYGSGILVTERNNLVKIYDNYFENIGSTAYDHGIYGAADDTKIYNNEFHSIVGAAIKLQTDQRWVSQNEVYNNLMISGNKRRDSYDSPTKFSGPTGIYVWGQNNKVYNNIIVGHYQRGISSSGLANKVYNNLIIGADIPIHFQNPTYAEIKNNIAIKGYDYEGSAWGYEIDTMVANRRPDRNILNNNLYYSSIDKYKFYLWGENGDCPSRYYGSSDSYLAALTKCGSRSEIKSIFGQDPLLASIDNMNFRPLAGSPAINAGDCPAWLTTDFDGNPRPTNGKCTLGPYEIDTTPPTLSNIEVIPDSTTAVVTWRTDELATSRIDYGLSANYGQNLTNSALTQDHSFDLSNLASSRTHYFKVTSTDQTGNVSSSANLTFATPTPLPLDLVSAVSRQTHNGVAYDLDLTTTIEPRRNPQIILTFNRGLRSEDNLVVAGHRCNQGLNCNQNVATLTLVYSPASLLIAGIQNSRTVGLMIGDVNNDRQVNILDLTIIRNHLGQIVGADNFLYDVNSDGTIDNFDLVTTRDVLNQSADGQAASALIVETLTDRSSIIPYLLLALLALLIGSMVNRRLKKQ